MTRPNHPLIPATAKQRREAAKAGIQAGLRFTTKLTKTTKTTKTFVPFVSLVVDLAGSCLGPGLRRDERVRGDE
jgi:hypothetical protein